MMLPGVDLFKTFWPTGTLNNYKQNGDTEKLKIYYWKRLTPKILLLTILDTKF